MSEHQAEARRIAKAVTHEAYKHGASVYGGLPEDDVDRAPTGRLVAALAAAIEVDEGCLCDMDPPCDELAANGVRERCEICSLHDALSALRQTDGEDT